MKIRINKPIIAIAAAIFCLTSILKTEAQNVAQPAKGINYQAVVRNNDGSLVANKNIKAVFSIIATDINGELIWKEEHINIPTNKYGLFTLSIGKGSKTGGSATSFSKIAWGKTEHYLKVEIAIDGSSELLNFGTTQMFSVPYALFADSARVARADFSGVTFDPVSNSLKNSNSVIADLSSLSQTLEYDPTSYHLSITGKPGIVDLRQFAHTPQDLRTLNNKLWITGNKDSTVVDLAPYKQTLSVSATSKLQISGGNEVQIDTSNVNEIQTLSLNGNKVALSKGGGEVAIDASETNELQTLSKVGNALVLSNAPNGRAIPVDTSLTNEIQTIQRSGNKLSLSGTTAEVSVDDGDADAGNELIGNITYNQNTRVLTVSEGVSNSKTVDISSKKVAFRAIKTTNLNVSTGSYTLVFADEKLDISNNYNASTGVFTVPANGTGLYIFHFTPESWTDPDLIYELLINDQNPELLLQYNQPVILELNENDAIKIRATASDATTIRKASFIGYKIN